MFGFRASRQVDVVSLVRRIVLWRNGWRTRWCCLFDCLLCGLLLFVLLFAVFVFFAGLLFLFVCVFFGLFLCLLVFFIVHDTICLLSSRCSFMHMSNIGQSNVCGIHQNNEKKHFLEVGSQKVNLLYRKIHFFLFFFF